MMTAEKASDLQYPNMKADLELCYKQLFAICKGERGPVAVMSIPPRTDNFDMQFSAAFDELKAYRETGLEPAQIKDMAQNTESRVLTWFESKYGFSAGELMRILEAKQAGKMIELPCPMGTKLWRVIHASGSSFASERFYIKAITLDVNNVLRIVERKEYGKTVFSSRKEAERAMAEQVKARMKEREEDE